MQTTNNMKVLNLIIKQEYFDMIMSGEKKQEYRDIKPTTALKLVEHDEDDYEMEDEDGNAIPIQYDAIRFFVGYRKDRDTALVEVKSAKCEVHIEKARDSKGNVMFFVPDENGEPAYYATGEDGDFVRDKDGNLIQVEKCENSCPLITHEHNGVPLYEPVEYYVDDKMWYEERVVYELGAILEKKTKERHSTRGVSMSDEKAFVFKYRVVDGAVDIADDFMTITMTLDQAHTLRLAYEMTDDETFDIDLAEGLDERIENMIEETAQSEYGNKIHDTLYAYVYDLKGTMAEINEWIESAKWIN